MEKKIIVGIVIAVLILLAAIGSTVESEPLDPQSEKCLAINLEYQNCLDNCGAYSFDTEHYNQCDDLCSTGTLECEREWMWE